MVIITKNARETKKVAALLASEILKKKTDLLASSSTHRSGPHALVIGLIGELGSGKTTFAQGFAQGLGIKEGILSPTFVLMKQYALKKVAFGNFIHVDCYRLNNQEELVSLGWRDIVKNPQNLILIEWADRVFAVLPRSFIRITFNHLNETSRSIAITRSA